MWATALDMADRIMGLVHSNGRTNERMNPLHLFERRQLGDSDCQFRRPDTNAYSNTNINPDSNANTQWNS